MDSDALDPLYFWGWLDSRDACIGIDLHPLQVFNLVGDDDEGPQGIADGEKVFFQTGGCATQRVQPLPLCFRRVPRRLDGPNAIIGGSCLGSFCVSVEIV